MSVASRVGGERLRGYNAGVAWEPPLSWGADYRPYRPPWHKRWKFRIIKALSRVRTWLILNSPSAVSLRKRLRIGQRPSVTPTDWRAMKMRNIDRPYFADLHAYGESQRAKQIQIRDEQARAAHAEDDVLT